MKTPAYLLLFPSCMIRELRLKQQILIINIIQILHFLIDYNFVTVYKIGIHIEPTVFLCVPIYPITHIKQISYSGCLQKLT